MCGLFKACNICKKFWKFVKAFVYHSFVVMSLFKIYFFLPGMILGNDEKELRSMKALNMLHEIFPERAFYSNAGPSVIMTDNCDELRNALKKGCQTHVFYFASFICYIKFGAGSMIDCIIYKQMTV